MIVKDLKKQLDKFDDNDVILIAGDRGGAKYYSLAGVGNASLRAIFLDKKLNYIVLYPEI